MFKQYERARLVYTLFALVVFSILGAIVVSIHHHGVKSFYQSNYGEFAVALGTILLALFTFELSYGEIENSRKERRRLRLKEQLQEFYSPFIGTMTEKRENEFVSIISMSFVKEKYEFLASEKLRNEIRHYFKDLKNKDSKFLIEYRLKKGSANTEKYVSDKLNK